MYYSDQRWYSKQKPKFAINYILVGTLSAQENAKLLQQLKTGFKGLINWNIYQSEENYMHKTDI